MHAPAMRILTSLLSVLLGSVTFSAAAAPAPESVVILYNAAIPESRKLAETYQAARQIPPDNVVALEMPTSADVSRNDYEEKIAAPLRAEFDRVGRWKRARDGNGVMMPMLSRIKVLVLMKGVPLRVLPTPKPPAKPTPPGSQPQNQDPLKGHDEASVDSELALVGVEGLPTEGVLKNQVYQAEKPISGLDCPFMLLTARIDAASYATCERMIRDAVATEKTGLWGMACVDIANKYPQGDQWLEAVARENAAIGIPTVVDRLNETLPRNYPLGPTSLYYGWYDPHISGPFLHPRFRFRPGAIAMHLHSFSAEQLSNPNKHWSAALLERGAACTIGNVFEPYLHLTHDFSILHKRLLAGFSWVEACWMATPAASWQTVVLGDPLYTPFRHLDGSGVLKPEDKEFRAVRAAVKQWPQDSMLRCRQLDKAADRLRSGFLAEASGLELMRLNLGAEAAIRFNTAKGYYASSEDKLRQDMHLVSMDLAAGRKELALRSLKDAKLRYAGLPEAEAVRGWLTVLEPPPLPNAQPGQPAASPNR